MFSQRHAYNIVVSALTRNGAPNILLVTPTQKSQPHWRYHLTKIGKKAGIPLDEINRLISKEIWETNLHDSRKSMKRLQKERQQCRAEFQEQQAQIAAAGSNKKKKGILKSIKHREGNVKGLHLRSVEQKRTHQTYHHQRRWHLNCAQCKHCNLISPSQAERKTLSAS